ncbi:hypothetical protein [Sphingomonas sp. G-3-2-10]|uniref:hypothetical protein n=1 Tax=Sphingomonas sp. G-3-2-10 TaxID=2728838 RepID=UPI001469E03E|nr:hypothetical protein [Sphingomonas sp. G-3-2-10]NML07696.1 hypothetical protein [Sphingomonas sp. G-3-2-10]
MSYDGGNDYEALVSRFAPWGVALLAALMIGLVAFAPVKADPDKRKAYGCFTAANASPIRLDAQGMRILQPEPIQIGFHLELHKTGIELTAEAPIEASPQGAGYRYAIKPPGIGRFLSFTVERDGRTYGVFDEDALVQFVMLADDGHYILYRKSAASMCPN